MKKWLSRYTLVQKIFMLSFLPVIILLGLVVVLFVLMFIVMSPLAYAIYLATEGEYEDKPLKSYIEFLKDCAQ